MGISTTGVLPQSNTASSAAFRPVKMEMSGVLQGLGEVERLLQSLVASWHLTSSIFQKRKWHRVIYRRPLVVVPIDEQTEEAEGKPRIVDGRDLSLGGISFRHTTPLPHRFVALHFRPEIRSMPWIVTCLTWCRFTTEGKYLSGGRFVRTTDLAVDYGPDWRSLPRA